MYTFVTLYDLEFRHNGQIYLQLNPHQLLPNTFLVLFAIPNTHRRFHGAVQAEIITENLPVKSTIVITYKYITYFFWTHILFHILVIFYFYYIISKLQIRIQTFCQFHVFVYWNHYKHKTRFPQNIYSELRTSIILIDQREGFLFPFSLLRTIFEVKLFS